MKQLFILIVSIGFLQVRAQETPFTKGVNLSGWFQTESPGQIHFAKYTKQDFENIKSLGADVIRLPINLHSMTSGAPNYELEPLFLNFLDQAVDWAEELEIHLILDNHTFNPMEPTDSNIDDILLPVWRNMAEHFKNRSELVYYEIMNEPHYIGDQRWNAIQQEVVSEIRKIDTIHTIIVGGANYNNYNNLWEMPEYEDDNLIYTFHFYDPFLFTHQGAEWIEPPLTSLANIPFPYDEGDMPYLPNELADTWIASLYTDYEHDAKISQLREDLDTAVQFKEERNVPVFCGEFGVYMKNVVNNDRVLWYQVVRSYLEEHGITWTSWDYHGGFGLFENNSGGMFEHDLNIPLLNALSLDAPVQTEFELTPDTLGFNIYSNYIETGIYAYGNSAGELSFYNEESHSGDYCIAWYSPSQYNQIGGEFRPIKDLSYLVENDYYISFWIKSDNPSTKFDIRFVDTKENDQEHPWRMSYAIDPEEVEFNGEWQYFQAPLSGFEESGSWDDEWYPPEGLFDWRDVQKFEIVDEYGNLTGTKLWFDEIKIFKPEPSLMNGDNRILTFELFQNYPNPFNPVTTIKFSLPERSNVNLTVYDILGNKVEQLIQKEKTAGIHSVDFNAENLPSGVYFCVLKTSAGFSSVKKALIIK